MFCLYITVKAKYEYTVLKIHFQSVICMTATRTRKNLNQVIVSVQEIQGDCSVKI